MIIQQIISQLRILKTSWLFTGILNWGSLYLFIYCRVRQIAETKTYFEISLKSCSFAQVIACSLARLLGRSFHSSNLGSLYFNSEISSNNL